MVRNESRRKRRYEFGSNCVINPSDYSYIQVAMTILNSKDTEDREYRSLEKINDNYPKYVLTMDSLIQKRNGIIHENVLSFMRDGKLFNQQKDKNTLQYIKIIRNYDNT